MNLRSRSSKKSTPKFEHLSNFRDVGQTVNAFTRSSSLKEGLLYRSARPDESTLPDRIVLRDDLGIKTIIDLRGGTEHQQQEEKRRRLLQESKDGEADIPPLQVPEMEYCSRNLNGSSFARFAISKLSWWDFICVLFFMMIGSRVAAIRIVGRGFMLSRGLSGLALDTLDVAGPEVKAVFDVLSQAKQYPVLLHCTQGKDRTGLVVQLVLMLLEISIDAIDYDYMLTVEQIALEMEEKRREIASIGLTEEFARCDPNLVKIVDAHIKEKYGGVRAYLTSIGVTEEQQSRIREILTNQL